MLVLQPLSEAPRLMRLSCLILDNYLGTEANLSSPTFLLKAEDSVTCSVCNFLKQAFPLQPAGIRPNDRS